MNTNITTAGRLGRAAGLAVAHTRRAVALIDWEAVLEIFVMGLVTAAILATVTSYHAGLELGRWLHRTNDRLARAWSALVVPVAAPTAEPVLAATEAPAAPAEPVAIVITAEPEPAPMARLTAVPHPLAQVRDQLMALPGKRLMELAGTRRKLPKAQLVAMVCAMA